MAGARSFGFAFVTLWTAALMRQFWPVWLRTDPLGPVARHPVLWRWNSLLFLTSALATWAGAFLTFAPVPNPLVVPALILLTAATALWAATAPFRIFVMTAAATDPTPGHETRYAKLLPWETTSWLIAAGLLIVVFSAVGAIVLTTGVLPAWVGWTTLGSAVFSTGLLIATRDLPPVVVYLPLLPLTVAVTGRARSAG